MTQDDQLQYGWMKSTKISQYVERLSASITFQSGRRRKRSHARVLGDAVRSNLLYKTPGWLANRLSRTPDLLGFVIEAWDAYSKGRKKDRVTGLGVVTALRLSPFSRSGSTSYAAHAFPRSAQCVIGRRDPVPARNTTLVHTYLTGLNFISKSSWL